MDPYRPCFTGRAGTDHYGVLATSATAAASSSRISPSRLSHCLIIEPCPLAVTWEPAVGIAEISRTLAWSSSLPLAPAEPFPATLWGSKQPSPAEARVSPAAEGWRENSMQLWFQLPSGCLLPASMSPCRAGSHRGDNHLPAEPTSSPALQKDSS